MMLFLTRVELHFADHYPFVGEVKLNFHVFPDVIVQLYVHVSGVFQHRVRHVRIPDRSPVIVLSTDTELHSCFREHLVRK